MTLTALLLVANLSIGLSCAAAEGDADLQFTVLHTNDLHAHDQSFSENGKLVGGMARVGHVIRELRAKDGDTVTIDAGDVFQGTPLYNLKHGEVEVNLLNKIGYDIATIGNHEFDDGPNNLAEQLQNAKYQVVCANLDFADVPALAKIVKPSVVRVINGEKVGFIGAMTPEIFRGSITLGGVKAKKIIDFWTMPIADEVTRLQSEGINKIVVISHCGIDFDQEMARNVPAIDVIVGGHSHTRLDSPLVIEHDGGSSTMIVQTGCYGRAVGELHLAFDAAGRLLKDKSHEHLIDISSAIPEDSDLKAYINEQSQSLKELDKQVLGRALGKFSMSFNDYLCDSPIGDLVCDALSMEAQKFGATIVLQNRGGIRSHIEAGPITAKDAESVLPFDNALVCATISGADLLRALENGLSGYLGARFLEVGGLKFAYDRSKPPGEKIVFALAQDKDGHWQPVDPSSQYRIAINSYNFQSGEGHDFSKAKDVEFLKQRLAVPFETYIRDRKEISPGKPTRIVALTPTIKIETSSSNGKVSLRATGVAENANLTLVAGIGKSVECIDDSTPVPLLQAKILRANSSGGKDGSCQWSVDGKDIDLLFGEQHPKEILLCVVEKRGTSLRDRSISYPVTVTLP
jgi:5'-nucleotidase